MYYYRVLYNTVYNMVHYDVLHCIVLYLYNVILYCTILLPNYIILLVCNTLYSILYYDVLHCIVLYLYSVRVTLLFWILDRLSVAHLKQWQTVEQEMMVDRENSVDRSNSEIGDIIDTVDTMNTMKSVSKEYSVSVGCGDKPLREKADSNHPIVTQDSTVHYSTLPSTAAARYRSGTKTTPWRLGDIYHTASHLYTAHYSTSKPTTQSWQNTNWVYYFSYQDSIPVSNHYPNSISVSNYHSNQSCPTPTSHHIQVLYTRSHYHPLWLPLLLALHWW